MKACVVLLLLVACGQRAISIDNRPCDDAGACAGGYACDTFRNICISLLEPEPPYVADLRATPGDEQVTLTFTLPNAFFHECQILRKAGAAPAGFADPTAFKISGTVTAAGAVEVVDRDLTNGTTYFYLALCRLGEARSDEARSAAGVVNSVSATPLDPAPANPTDFMASDGETGKVTLHFTMPPPPVSECQVRRDTTATPSAHTAGALAATLFGAGVKNVVDPMLDAGVTYFYAVFCRYGTTFNDSVAVSNSDTAVPL